MIGHFEAKKHAYRQTQDGVVISFVIHPDEVDSALATASLGTRYMIGFAEIGEDGKPVKAPPPVAVKESKPFNSLPLSQQAAIRCSDPEFQRWLGGADESQTAEFVRERCGVSSRSALKEGTLAGIEWMFMEEEYQTHLTTQRYGSLAR